MLGMEAFPMTRTFGAFWLYEGRIVGAFLEVGSMPPVYPLRIHTHSQRILCRYSRAISRPNLLKSLSAETVSVRLTDPLGGEKFRPPSFFNLQPSTFT